MTDPTIVMFMCRNARTALSGPEGTEAVPPDVRVIEVPCSGRVDEVMMLKALRNGAWAVMVVACLDGNCKNSTGNYQARRRVDEARSLLAQLGVDAGRIRMYSVASNQHAMLMAAVGEMQAFARERGPIKILEGDR
ncbi:MAG: hydrogenase iron-sulfur subunit [Methanomassiliicoccus sp.]|nr:hydrogenase iron-sulfur subunit [Methanomassiliicoccus sp.]